jgi:hypothetical protein
VYGIREKKKKKERNSVALVRERTILSDRRLSAKLVPTFADRGCSVVSVTDPHGRILVFPDRMYGIRNSKVLKGPNEIL